MGNGIYVVDEKMPEAKALTTLIAFTALDLM
jgi:hypothetical protein